MAPPNPLESQHSKSSAAISVATFYIAGIITEVYGLDELPPSSKSVACLWLLHPRGGTKQRMASAASSCINDWNQRAPPKRSVGLIAVAFDQRNHGSREVNGLANESWRGGNVTHAQDMFSILHGTALDTSLLMDHLGSYILLGPNDPSIDQHLVLGISLGGHSAWQSIFLEPRVTAAVVIIGCPDIMRLMSDRARLSKLETFGPKFLGSKDFPNALIYSSQKWDPKGLLFGIEDINANPSVTEQNRRKEVVDQKLEGKRILVCSGGDDKLVPYHCSEPFLQFLKQTTKDSDIYIEDNVYPGVGHEYSEGMIADTTRFVSDTLAGVSGKPTPKI